METKEKKIVFDELRLTMTESEYEETDFYELTDNYLMDFLKRGGETAVLEKKYAITIVDEQKQPIRVEYLTVRIASNVFLSAHKNVSRRPFDGVYVIY